MTLGRVHHQPLDALRDRVSLLIIEGKRSSLSTRRGPMASRSEIADRLTAHILHGFEEEHGAVFRDDKIAMPEIRAAAQRAAEEINAEGVATITLSFRVDGQRAPIRFEARLTARDIAGLPVANALAKRVSPEEEEAAKIQVQMAVLEEELARVSAEDTRTEADLRRFMQDYQHRMGPYFTRLDRWRVRCDEVRWTLDRLEEVAAGDRAMPEGDETSSPENAWQEEREKAFEKAWEEAREEPVEAPAPEPELSEQDTARAKKIHRELVRRYHPDLANSASEEEREQRNMLMTQINEAWEQKDLARLMALQNEPDFAPPEGESIGDRIVRLIRKRASVQKAVRAAEKRLKETIDSPEGRLFERFQSSEGEGSDPWTNFIEQLERHIQREKDTWARLREQETATWTELD